MTFREMVLQEESYRKLPFHGPLEEQSVFRSVVSNQSPVMKIWFGMMLVNLIMIIWLI